MTDQPTQPAGPSALGRSVRVLRRGLTWILIVLVAVGVLGTTVAFWADQTLFDTDRYVATVSPILTDPAVIEAVSTDVSASIVQETGIQKVVEGVLPADLTGLADVVVQGLQDTIRQAIATFMSSEQFATFWREANRTVHAEIVAILRGRSDIVSSTDGVVSVDVFPLVAKGLQVADTALSDALGREVGLPVLTDPTNAALSRSELESALGVTLPPDFGEIVIADTTALEQARLVLQVFEASIVIAAVVTLAIAVLAVAVSLRRRRAALQVVVASGIGLALALVAVARIDELAADSAPAGAAGATARAAIVSIVGGFEWYALVLFVALVVVAIALYVAGRPSWIPRWGRRLREAAGVQPSGSSFVRVVSIHVGELRLAGYAVAIVALLLVPFGFGSIVGTLVLLLAYQVLLTVVRAFRPADIRAAEALG